MWYVENITVKFSFLTFCSLVVNLNENFIILQTIVNVFFLLILFLFSQPKFILITIYVLILNYCLLTH